MSKDKLKQKANVGVAAHSDPHFEGITKNKKGITLIALIITIIVMLILVGVSVTVALNGGLFTTAKGAQTQTQLELDRERLLEAAMGAIGEDGKVDPTKIVLPEGFTESEGIYTSPAGNRFTITDYGSINPASGAGEGNGDGSDQNPETTYTIGTEVTIGETGENFYVIKDNGAELVLLAKNNINTTSFKQADGNNPVIFATDSSYWMTDEEYTERLSINSDEMYEAWVEKWGYPKDLNKYSICPEGSAISLAREYATETIGNGATGRLMTYEEAKPLSESEDQHIRKILYGTYTEGAYLNYWLSSAAPQIAYVYCIDGEIGSYGNSGLIQVMVSNLPGSIGVRPVVVVSKSAVFEISPE